MLHAEATMDVVEMVLGGRVNKGLVTMIQQAGGQAVGLCGKDSNIIRARQMIEKDIGFVGDITSVKKDLIEALVREQYIPVVASVAADPATGQALNVNADIAAGEVNFYFLLDVIASLPTCSIGQAGPIAATSWQRLTKQPSYDAVVVCFTPLQNDRN